jgi:hypothetical protein
MRRWHDPREHALMFRRWKFEMAQHGYDWRNPPDPKCDRHACHCAAGIGSMRKKAPLDCGRPRCLVCHSDKYLWPKNRANLKREAIRFELEADD